MRQNTGGETEDSERASAGAAETPVTVEGPFVGQYANSIQISSSPWEFVVDFGLIDRNGPLADPISGKTSTAGLIIRQFARIIISPQNIKGFHRALGETIEKYEKIWGIELRDMRAVTALIGEQGARNEQGSDGNEK